MPGFTNVSNVVLELEAAYTNRADLADLGRAGSQARRLEIDDDVGRVLEQQVVPERTGERHRVAAPGEPRVGVDDLGEQRAREPDGRLAEGEETAGRLLGDDGAPPLLDELHEPVGRIEPELHGTMLGEQVFDCQPEAILAPWRPSAT